MATKKKPTFHVSRSSCGTKWGARKSGKSKASALFDDRKSAIDYCLPRAKRVYVHGEDGRIQEYIDAPA